MHSATTMLLAGGTTLDIAVDDDLEERTVE